MENCDIKYIGNKSNEKQIITKKGSVRNGNQSKESVDIVRYQYDDGSHRKHTGNLYCVGTSGMAAMEEINCSCSVMQRLFSSMVFVSLS